MPDSGPERLTRGGAAEFKWTDVAGDAQRENYLGHSINAPVGRWQKNKDIHWYNKDHRTDEQQRLYEIKKIRQAEEDALSLALGFAPAPREPTPPPLTEEEQAAMEEARMQAKAERKALKHMEKEEKRAQKEERRKDKHAKRAVKHERRDGSRSRHRSEEPLDRDGRRRDDRSPRDRRESNDRRRREPSHEQDRRERRRSRSPAPRRY